MPNDDSTHPGAVDPWRRASEGLDLLRLSMILNIIVSILFKVLPSSGVMPLIQIIASVAIAAMAAVALVRWRAIPAETGGQGAAGVAAAAAWVVLAASIGLAAVVAVAMGRGPWARHIQPYFIAAAIALFAASLVQTIAFLTSCRTLAIHLIEPDIAGRAITVLVLWVIANLGAVWVTLSAVAFAGAQALLLLALAGVAIVGLVLYIGLLRSLQDAIRRRPSLAEVFS
ncbi:MAG: hypothetical protein U1F43_06290 [Myxococcota bacterium]